MAGQPTLYSVAMYKATEKYIDNCEDEHDQLLSGLSVKGTELYKNVIRVHIPTIEGLAYELGVHKDTIYEWRKVHPEYSELIGRLLAKQARELIEKGLSGDYNPTIAKVLLTKHGYREGIENTGADGSALIPEKLDEEKATRALTSVLGQKHATQEENTTRGA